MRQIAPDPTELFDLVAGLSYHRGWTFELEDIDRGQGCEGLTLTIAVTAPDTYHPERQRRTGHLFPVPAAAFDRRSWRRWLFDRIEDVHRHEAMEGVLFGPHDDVASRPFAPTHGSGRRPLPVGGGGRPHRGGPAAGRAGPRGRLGSPPLPATARPVSTQCASGLRSAPTPTGEVPSMPSQDFAVAPDEPLFTDEDPLTISIPGVKGAAPDSPDAGGKWRALDRANFPLEDGWEHRQISYLVEAMRLQVCCDNIECASGQNTDCEHEEPRATFEAALVRAYELSRISVTNIGDIMRWLGDEREKAEKGAVSRKVKRPTSARRRSTP